MRKFVLKPKVYLEFFDHFPGYIALLDERGNILATNKTWQESALKRGLLVRPDCIGTNYLKLFDNLSEEEKVESLEIKEGLESVLAGKRSLYKKIYSLIDPERGRVSYLLTIFALKGRPKMVILIHEELPHEQISISSFERKESEERAPSSEWDLLVNHVLFPFLELLKGKLPPELETLRTDTLKALQEFRERRLRSLHPLAGLSIKEAQVALLVKEGYSSEEICQILNLSKDAVDFYRKRLREKFGLKGQSLSLKAYLRNLFSRESS